ncbi:MAG: hypothetical protein L6R40_008282 [Gallowayella cf. fulva]|nr:MAG: hypothetical protein L6R40_008282 [Xanthomendoza cf. fulva]
MKASRVWRRPYQVSSSVVEEIAAGEAEVEADDEARSDICLEPRSCTSMIRPLEPGGLEASVWLVFGEFAALDDGGVLSLESGEVTVGSLWDDAPSAVATAIWPLGSGMSEPSVATRYLQDDSPDQAGAGVCLGSRLVFFDLLAAGDELVRAVCEAGPVISLESGLGSFAVLAAGETGPVRPDREAVSDACLEAGLVFFNVLAFKSGAGAGDNRWKCGLVFFAILAAGEIRPVSPGSEAE